jgi:hypothetical protein
VEDELLMAAQANPEIEVPSFDPPPLDRETARREAWATADADLQEPWNAAEEISTALAEGTHEYPWSPGFKLTVVPASDARSPAPKATVSDTTETALSLHAAARRWVQSLRLRVQSNDVSEDHVLRIESVTIKRLIELVPDYSLESLGKPELDAIRLTWQSAPNKNTGKLKSRATIDTELGHLRTMFNWLEESELWPAPKRKWEKWLRPVYRGDDLDGDADEDEAKVVDTYTVPELVKLYSAASKTVRLWILCALNFGWGAKEIDTARKSHFKSKGRRVARYRHKRTPGAKPVRGRWKAWDETWTLATARIANTTDDEIINPKRLAFLTKHGQPLVRMKRAERSGKVRRYDAIAEAFATTCANAGVRCRGFYLLRHTGIGMIESIAGEAIADLYCQHRPKSMTRRHYLNADWRKLRIALGKLRRKLRPMFAAATRGAESPSLVPSASDDEASSETA